MKNIIRISKSFLLLLLATTATLPVFSQENRQEEVLPDSSNFVTASVIITSPGKEVFYSLGHCGLHLSCPSKDLDYCFSFSTTETPGPLFNLKLMFGRMKAGYEALPYREYIKMFEEEGRGVTEYPLNLTLHEEQMLWKVMDEKMLKGPVFPFDFVFNNCTAPLFRTIGSIMDSEDFFYPEAYPLTLNAREQLHLVSENSPWLEFITVIMVSNYAHKNLSLDTKLYPRIWSEMLPKAEIVGLDGSRRAALESAPVKILEQKLFIEPFALTPNITFGVLLAIAFLLVLGQRFWHWRSLPAIFDTALFIGYSLLSLYLFYASCAKIYGIFWNWFLIVFNPLPVLVWFFRKHISAYPKVFLAYSLMIVGFMLFLPVYTERMEWPHELLLATLLVRSLNSFMVRRTK